MPENVIALAEAHKVGASEAIVPNTVGNLCEGTGTNVFAVIGGELVTPPLLAGCLAGVTRALVLDLLPDADEADVPMTALAGADEVLLTSTTRDVQPLRLLDGRLLPGVDGPWAQRAMAAIADLQSRDLDPDALARHAGAEVDDVAHRHRPPTTAGRLDHQVAPRRSRRPPCPPTSSRPRPT